MVKSSSNTLYKLDETVDFWLSLAGNYLLLTGLVGPWFLKYSGQFEHFTEGQINKK